MDFLTEPESNEISLEFEASTDEALAGEEEVMSILQEKVVSLKEHTPVEETERASFDPAPEVAPSVLIGRERASDSVCVCE